MFCWVFRRVFPMFWWVVFGDSVLGLVVVQHDLLGFVLGFGLGLGISRMYCLRLNLYLEFGAVYCVDTICEFAMSWLRVGLF